MAPYTGSGNFPYFMTISNAAGNTNATANSENIPVTPNLNYTFSAILSFTSTWASGAQLNLVWYDANGNLISFVNVGQANMTGGVLYQLSTAPTAAPSNASFAIAQIALIGNPGAANLLNVYQAEIDDANYVQVNINYTFSYTFWPWSPSPNFPNLVLGWSFNPLLAADSDSLVLNGAIELMGGAQGVPADIPELLDSNGQGPTYRILAPPSLNSQAFGYQPSYDLNAPQPTQDVVASMLLDGERPFGARASNRTISLPIVIFGTQAGGMAQVLAAREFLMSVIDQQTWQIKWTPADTGLGMLFDCFRALPSSPLYGFNYSAGGTATGTTIGRPNYPIAMITLSIQALPYGRSEIDGVQALQFNSPIVNGVPASAAVSIDTFTTVFNPPPVINKPTWTNLGSNNPTSVTTWNIALGSNVNVGNTIIVEIESASNNITSVTDTQGNPYTLMGSQQAASTACWQFVYTAPAFIALASGTDHITVNAGGSANFSSVAFSINGAFSLRNLPVNTNGTGTSFTANLAGLNQYDLLVSCAFGLGASGATPTNFTSLGANSGNGFNNLLAWFAQPINQFNLTYTIASGLASGGWGIMLFALQPTNQYWNQESNSAPPTFTGKSVHYEPPRPMHTPYPAASYQQTLPAPVSIVGCPTISVWFGQAYDTQWPKDPKFTSDVILRWTLTDNVGRNLSFSGNLHRVRYGTHPTVPKWSLINARIPQGKGFNYNAVASYSVRITNWHGSGHSGYVRMHCWLNNIVANPQTLQNPMSPRGSVYQIFALPGSARAPISVQCQLPAMNNITKEITGPSSGTWIVPPGVYNVNAEAWAGGGAGAAANLNRSICGGGGGGGEWANEPALSVMPGMKVPWSIGAGGTPAQLQNTVIQYTKDGLGHWTCPPNVSTVFAEMWGGGAAGAAGGGGGGGAEYAAVHVPVTPGTTYALWTGRGGKADTGISAAQVKARQGEASWFGPMNNQQPATAYTQAHGGSTGITGGTGGGYGGTSGAVAPQTQTSLIGFANPGAATKFTFSPSFPPLKKLPVGDTGLLVISVPAAATITVSDTSKNTWKSLGPPATNTGSFTYVFACFNASALNQKSIITINQSVSQNATIGLLDVPWVIGTDATVTLNSGTGTSPAVTSATPNYANELVIAIFTDTGANTNATPAGWTLASPNLGVGPFTNIYALQNATTSPVTATSGYAASQTWASMAITFLTEAHNPGGRGGNSPASSGGGGGGAAGATGPGGVGGDSPVSILGRFAGGGAAGQGNGQGGNGGIGAATPGFPTVGSAPGGGGGGGFTQFPIATAANPSNALPGQAQTNFLGADGGSGMVQLTYAVGGGGPVNGGNTTFGSAGTTGTVVTAHGGTSAASNSAAGAAGGTGSSNSAHNNGGNGGLNLGTTQGSYMATPAVTTILTTLNHGAYNAASTTSGVSAASVAQGCAIALICSTAQVGDLQVTDSAGNIYQLSGIQAAGASHNGATAYAYVANLEFPITTSTTLSISSATSQQYGYLWYGSPWLVSGVTTNNSGTGNGTSASFTGQFSTGDAQSVSLELGVTLCDGSTTVTGFNLQKIWFNGSSTNSQVAGAMQLSSFVTENQGGGTGIGTATGDIFSGSLSGSANWAVLCVPLMMINQQAAMIRMDWRSGTTPGAQTTWTNNIAMSANGLIVVAGMCGSGASISAGPSAIADASGNTYSFKNTTVLPVSGGAMWIATAPVTHALAAGTTGTINWGNVSAAPNYWVSFNWVPNAVTAIDTNGVSAVTGTASAVSGTYAPAQPNDQLFAFLGNSATSFTVSPAPSAVWNETDTQTQNYLHGNLYNAQCNDETSTAFSCSLSAGSASWGLLMTGIQMTLAGTGGGAAGGPNNAGYPGIWEFGGPAFAGGGKGGQGAAPPPQSGNGAAYPGGGGGGSYSNTTAGQEGGQGAPGALRLTWTPPLQTFNTLIVHSLGADSDQRVCPMVNIPITDVPNNTEYLVASVDGLLPATFSSTYSVILANFFWNAVTSAIPRQITVTINQYEYPGGPKYSVQVSRAVTPATDSVNGLLSMGEVTLPVKDYLAYNDQSYFTISINDTDTSDRFMDVLFLDTLGQTVLINIDPGQSGFGQYVNYFIDEATSDRDLGFIGASFQDRQHQVSVLDYAQVSGGPLYIGPGDNLFLVYSTSGAPNLAVNYSPRWFLDRSVLS